MPSEKKILVIIPAFNAAGYLPELLSRLKIFIDADQILIIDDGSTDNSLEILKREGINYISFLQNKGKGAALLAGFDYALKNNYRSVLTLDADLQHPPEDIPRFIAMDNGQRVIIGTRKMTLAGMPFLRWLTNNLTSQIISIFSTQRIRDSQSGYRLIPVELIKKARLETINYDLESEILFKVGAMGYDIIEVPVATIYEGSHSYINPLIDTGRFIRQIWKRIWI